MPFHPTNGRLRCSGASRSSSDTGTSCSDAIPPRLRRSSRDPLPWFRFRAPRDRGMTERDRPRDRLKEWRVEELLERYSGLRLVPTRSEGLKLAGPITFSAHPQGLETITDQYSV